MSEVTWHAVTPARPSEPSLIEDLLADRLRQHDTNNRFAALVAALRPQA